MVVNASEREVLQHGHEQSETTEDEVDPQRRVENSHVLYPEAVLDINTEGNSSNDPSLCHQKDVHHGHGSLDKNHSVDAADEFSSPASTSSSSESESKDVGLGEKPTSKSGVSSESDKTHLSFKNERSSFSKPEEPENSSNNHTAFLDSNTTCKAPFINTPSPMHNPPAQVMDRNEGYDTKRIPSSVFARKDSEVPAEWSFQSNDSLFSLQVGTTSISREQTLLLSGELERLTQLSKAGDMLPAELKELEKLAELTNPGEILMPSPPPQSIPEVKDDGEAQETKNLEGQKEMTCELKREKSVPKTNKKSHQHQPPSTDISNLSRPSDVSEDSTHSFAFPILGHGEKGTAASRHVQWQSEQPVEAKRSPVTPAPVGPRKSERSKRRCFDCHSCSRFFSCSHFFPCSRCSYSPCCLPCCCCFSCRFSCACPSRKSCCRKYC